MATRSRSRGFTLAELMIVVVIMGVLATLAVYGVRNYLKSAKTSEAFSMIASIQAAQEAFRDETYRYLDVSGSLTDTYPSTNPGTFKSAWENPGHTDYANWRTLGVTATGPVYYGYATTAGLAGTTPTQPPGAVSFNWAAQAATTPWYVIRAAGDLDGDDVDSVFVGSSFTNEIWVGDKYE